MDNFGIEKADVFLIDFSRKGDYIFLVNTVDTEIAERAARHKVVAGAVDEDLRVRSERGRSERGRLERELGLNPPRPHTKHRSRNHTSQHPQ